MTDALIVVGPSPLPLSILLSLSPLLVTSLKTNDNKFTTITFNFWALTYDLQEGLSYPLELADAFHAYAQTRNIPRELRLTGLDLVRGDDLSSGHPTNVSDSNVMAVHETQSNDMSTDMELGSSEPECEILSKTQRGDDEVVLSTQQISSQLPILQTCPAAPPPPQGSSNISSQPPIVGVSTCGETVSSVSTNFSLYKDCTSVSVSYCRRCNLNIEDTI